METDGIMDADLVAQVKRAFAAEPEFMRRFLSDISPAAEPVDDYIADREERCALFGQLQQLHRDLGVPMPNAATLGFFMVAPVAVAREHLEQLRGPGLAQATMLRAVDQQALGTVSSWMRRAVPAWLGRRGSLSRDTPAAVAAHKRNGDGCFLSGIRDPFPAPIVPFTTTQSDFLDLDTRLESFWGTAKALHWRNLYKDLAMTRSVANHLSLDRHLHACLSKAKFALKPIAQTPTSVTLQFHWLRPTELRPSSVIDASPAAVLDSAGLEGAGWGSGLAHRPSGVPIKTGQTYVVRAEKHEELPSFELLELQWNLLRVAAICGAGEGDD